MKGILSQNQEILLGGGVTCRVIDLLGAGAQGEVYRIATPGGEEQALKWYYSTSATSEQRQILEELIKDGCPSEAFLWPIALASCEGVSGFGYVMRLRPTEYRSFNDLMGGKVDPSFSTLIRTGIELAKAFRSLHAKGLCYRDISFGNAFFHPLTGEILVCDNDNVATNNSCDGGILGTPDFMAPEIVRTEASPSNKTDLHSLAVLLFYLLFMSHPLFGRKILAIRCWDGPAREKLLGKEPVFIFHPTDASNAAVDFSEDSSGEAGGNAIHYWKMYPKDFRDTVTKAFTVGVSDPDRRVTEYEWIKALSSLRDSLFKCACGASAFYDVDAVKAAGGVWAPLCRKCGNPLKLPFRIRIDRDGVDKQIVLLNAESQLFQHHIKGDRDFSTVVAKLSQHPNDPSLWGLKNLSSQKWTATLANGQLRDIEPGKSVPLAKGVKIQFAPKCEGEIRY